MFAQECSFARGISLSMSKEFSMGSSCHPFASAHPEPFDKLRINYAKQFLSSVRLLRRLLLLAMAVLFLHVGQITPHLTLNTRHGHPGDEIIPSGRFLTAKIHDPS